MATCDSCGGHVTDRFRQVFGSNDGEVFGCLDCQERGKVINGKIAHDTTESA